MKKVGWPVALLLFGVHAPSWGTGVSPYLPLNIEPDMQSQIERVMILADMPAMRRPFAAATVLDAIAKAHKIDPALCDRVQKYISRYMHTMGIGYASVEGAASSGKGNATVAPNRYGMEESSHWDAAAQLYWQPSSYLLVNAGAVAYEGKTDYTGSMISLGWDFAQLDVGFRPHWLSPFTDSSMLLSTEAATMPSVTLSNNRPLTRFGLGYELFAARMSRSDRIVFGDGFTSGHPRLAGVHIESEPANGWSIALNRLEQYGGGLRGGGSVKDLFKAFFNPSGADNTTAVGGAQVGNQQASITSNLLFPGAVPFSVYFEYAGEDTSHGQNYLLGNSSLSIGMHFPKLWTRFDLTLEASEWQNAWYVHNIYQDGMTNYHRVTGNWFGDQRVFGDDPGGRSGMIQLGYEPPFGGLLQLQYRTMQNQRYTGIDYKRFQDLTVRYSHPWQRAVVGAEVDAGRDVFGANFTRLAGFLRYNENGGGLTSIVAGMTDAGSDDEKSKAGEIFIDAGANASRQSYQPGGNVPRTTGSVDYGYHFGVGARRFVSDHSDLGARIEIDNVQGHNLLGVRAIDYRYRFQTPFALGLFLGAARYDLVTPAYGIYLGGGLQYRNLLPGWDLGVDIRYADNVARDHLVPGDPATVGGHNDSFNNILSTTLSLSRHF